MKANVCTSFATVALLMVVCFSSGIAQDKAIWTGTWKMVPEKTQFANGDGPSSIVIKLELKEGAVTETLTVETPGGERNFTATYTTDSKPSTQDVLGGTAQTTAKWDGAALVIDFKREGWGFTRKINLSSDGKTMTIAVHHSGDNGEADETVVLERQSS